MGTAQLNTPSTQHEKRGLLSPCCPWSLSSAPVGPRLLQPAPCSAPHPLWAPGLLRCPQGSDSREPQEGSLVQDALAEALKPWSRLPGGSPLPSRFQAAVTAPTLRPSGLGMVTAPLVLAVSTAVPHTLPTFYKRPFIRLSLNYHSQVPVVSCRCLSTGALAGMDGV